MRSSILARIPGFRQRIIPEPSFPSQGSQAQGTRLSDYSQRLVSCEWNCQPSLSVVYYSILQYIAGTSRQYGYQPGVSVVYYQPAIRLSAGRVCSILYYSILQTRPADSRIAGWYPRCIVVYYSILQTGRSGPADSRIVGW